MSGKVGVTEMSRLPSLPSRWARSNHRGLALVACTLGACAAAAIVFGALRAFTSPSGTPGWTGAAVKVPYCPTDAYGCRLFVARGATGGVNAPGVAYKDWSGNGTTLNLVLPAGAYAVSAEGCAGYQIPNTQISVRSGFHATVDLGVTWEMPEFPTRGCPGFRSAAVGLPSLASG
jgi:hypothetical protein